MVKKKLVAIICAFFVLSFVNLSVAKDKSSSEVVIESVKVKLGDFFEKSLKRFIFFGFSNDSSVYIINGSDPLPDPPMPPPPPPTKGGGN